MNVITNKISMDLMTAPEELPKIHAVQGETNTRTVEMAIFCGGNPWEIPQGTRIAVRYGRVGQGGGYYDTLPDGSCAYSYEGNTVTIILAPQMMSVAGTVTAQVELIHGDQVLVTFSFKVIVAVNPAVGITEPEDYINWQQWLEQELDAYIAKINQSGQLLGGTMAGPINMNGNTLSGLNPPEEDDQAASMGFVNQQVRTAAPRNLLDNSDFRNPVMQAGFDELHGSERYVIDRWRRLYGIGVVSEVSNGILISGADTECYINQKIDITNIVGKAVTMAVCTSEEGILCGSVVLQENTDMQVFASKNGLHLMTNGGGFTVRVIAGYAYTVEWIALYEGEYTADTLPEYQPKGYGAELLECQRYYAKINGAIAYGVATSNGKAEFLVPHPTTMRKQWPSYVFKNNLWAYKGDGGALLLSITGVSTTSGSIRIYADLENGTNTIISVPDVNVEISADIL